MNLLSASLGSSGFDATDAFNAKVYGGKKHPDVLKFIQSQRISDAYDRYENGYAHALRQQIDRYAGQEWRDFTREVSLDTAGACDKHYVFLNNLGSIQKAGRTMVPAIMACPEVLNAYRAGQLEGYDGAFVDDKTNPIGFGNALFMKATNGMLDGEELVHYVHSGEVDQLSFDEKRSIIQTWDVVRKLVEDGGQDPTSPTGNLL